MGNRAEIRTARLKLRPVNAEDGPALVAAIDDYAVSQWLAVVPYPYTDADFQHFLHNIAKPGSTWVIEDAQGFAGVVSLDPHLGYWLAPRAHGMGHMTEAARAVLAGHFADADTDVASGHFEGNAPSRNVLTKLGFVEVGRDPNPNRAQGRDLPHVDMNLTKVDFVAALPIEARSNRLSFRMLQPTDAPALHAIASHWEVVRQLGSWPWPPEPAFPSPGSSD